MYDASVKWMVMKDGEDLNKCTLIQIYRCQTECVTLEKTNRTIIKLRELNLKSILWTQAGEFDHYSKQRSGIMPEKKEL